MENRDRNRMGLVLGAALGAGTTGVLMAQVIIIPPKTPLELSTEAEEDTDEAEEINLDAEDHGTEGSQEWHEERNDEFEEVARERESAK